MRRRSDLHRKRRSGKVYSLDELLARQPSALRKDPRYDVLLSHFLTSDPLKRIRFGSRCFRLLDKALIDPENLPFFYKTYRLPKDPFFPLFFQIKRSYFEDRKEWREKREEYILGKMKSLPPHQVRFIRFLGEWEQSMNRKGDFPCWMKYLYPETKKRVHEYERFGPLEWEQFFSSYLVTLTRRYHLESIPLAEQLASCSLLELQPSAEPFSLPGRPSVLRAFRSLSMRYHPDRGGDPEVFVRLQKAKEVLCGSQSRGS